MTEVILVVDDEPFVLNVVAAVLRQAGFVVLSAATPQEALEIARGHAGPIQLLLSDVQLPELSGPSLADCVLEIHPEAECMFMAGLPDTPEICDRIIARGRPFLPKPFLPRTLVSQVREVLARSTGLCAKADSFLHV